MITLDGTIPARGEKTFEIDVQAPTTINEVAYLGLTEPKVACLRLAGGKNLVPFALPLMTALKMAKGKTVPPGPLTLTLRNPSSNNLVFKLTIS